MLRAEGAAVAAGATAEVRGLSAVATTFSGRVKAARSVPVDGRAGAVWARGGKPRVVFDITVHNGRIVAIELIADAERLAALELRVLEA